MRSLYIEEKASRASKGEALPFALLAFIKMLLIAFGGGGASIFNGSGGNTPTKSNLYPYKI